MKTNSDQIIKLAQEVLTIEAEEILKTAIKCKYCKEDLNTSKTIDLFQLFFLGLHVNDHSSIFLN